MRKHNKCEVKKKIVVTREQNYVSQVCRNFSHVKQSITFTEINLIKFFSCFVNFKISYIFIRFS